jgi:hypothetical protein
MSSQNIKSKRQDLKKDNTYYNLLKKYNPSALKYFVEGKYSYFKSIKGVPTAGQKIKGENKIKI